MTWKEIESARTELHYWWRAWQLYGCGNFTLRRIRDALKEYDSRLPPPPEGDVK